MAAVQVEFDPLLASGDGFSLTSFDVGFDEGIPEPTTFALMTIGLSVLACAVWRRRNTA